jgi:3-deoxy-7-phosphoheptulonate synthase
LVSLFANIIRSYADDYTSHAFQDSAAMIQRTDDLRIREIKELDSPERIHQELPISERAAETTFVARQGIQRILQGEDDRAMVVIGPCSIHDVEAAREYATRLARLAAELRGDLLLVMRVYFEKPRTIVGWKGLINDPRLDGSFEINLGLRMARKLLLDINELGVPAGTEFLDLVTGQYFADLISWGAIGARTVESQGHRELASGLSCPVGFKNATNGSVKVAIDAMRSAAHPHIFLSPTKQGRTAIFSTRGNRDTHVILRGGTAPNYDARHVEAAAAEMCAAGLEPRLVIDLSHGNSNKIPRRQLVAGRAVARQIGAGDRRLVGVMIESHLLEGRQDVVPGRELVYGLSITDACLGWDDSESLLRELAAAVAQRRLAVQAG